MTDDMAPHNESAARDTTDAAARRVDWEGIERSPEFRELLRRRRRFVVPATIFFLAWYLGFILLAGYAPGFMGERVYQGVTVGYLLALSQFVMVWVLAWLYLRKADREFDPLERAAARRAEQLADTTAAAEVSRPAAAPAAGSAVMRTEAGR